MTTERWVKGLSGQPCCIDLKTCHNPIRQDSFLMLFGLNLLGTQDIRGHISYNWITGAVLAIIYGTRKDNDTPSVLWSCLTGKASKVHEIKSKHEGSLWVALDKVKPKMTSETCEIFFEALQTRKQQPFLKKGGVNWGIHVINWVYWIYSTSAPSLVTWEWPSGEQNQRSSAHINSEERLSCG